jgi:hypothetical protein
MRGDVFARVVGPVGSVRRAERRGPRPGVARGSSETLAVGPVSCGPVSTGTGDEVGGTGAPHEAAPAGRDGPPASSVIVVPRGHCGVAGWSDPGRVPGP